MLYRTHLALAFFAGMLTLPLFSPGNQILFLLIIMFSALLPDVDHPNSKIGRYLKPIGFLFEHRGFFHSIFPVILFVFLLTTFGKNVYIWPFVIGYCSHLVGDLVTRQGIMPFHPLSRMRITGWLKTGSGMESIILVALVAVDAYLLFQL